MIELLAARARAEGLAIETRVMDCQALELDDDSFDIAGSQFGVMLFPDIETVLGRLKLTDDERDLVRQRLGALVRERADESGTTTLTNPVHIGIGTK